MLGEHRKAQLELRMRLGMGNPETEAYVFSNHEVTATPPSRSQRTRTSSRKVIRARRMPSIRCPVRATYTDKMVPDLVPH